MLGGHVLVLQLLRLVERAVEHLRERGRDAWLLRHTFRARLLGELFLRLGPQRVRVRDERAREILVEQRE